MGFEGGGGGEPSWSSPPSSGGSSGGGYGGSGGGYGSGYQGGGLGGMADSMTSAFNYGGLFNQYGDQGGGGMGGQGSDQGGMGGGQQQGQGNYGADQGGGGGGQQQGGFLQNLIQGMSQGLANSSAPQGQGYFQGQNANQMSNNFSTPAGNFTGGYGDNLMQSNMDRVQNAFSQAGRASDTNNPTLNMIPGQKANFFADNQNTVNVTPDATNKISDNTLRFIMAHELTHNRNGDSENYGNRMDALSQPSAASSGNTFMPWGMKQEEQNADKGALRSVVGNGYGVNPSDMFNGTGIKELGSLSPKDSHYGNQDRMNYLNNQMNSPAIQGLSAANNLGLGYNPQGAIGLFNPYYGFQFN